MKEEIMTIGKLAMCVALSVGFVGCDSSDAPDAGSGESLPAHKIEIPLRQKASLDKANEFAFSAWKHICEEATENEGNQIFLPLSLQMALSMVANAASGDMLDEIVGLYAEGDSKEALESLNDLNRKLLNELPMVDKGVNVGIANSLWCDKLIDFKSEFVNVCGEKYDASAHKYEVYSNQARIDVNQWCSDKTNGMIPEFLTGNPESGVMIINSSYFRGKWKYPFDKSLTKAGNFQCESGAVKEVAMMTNREYVIEGRENNEMVYVVVPYGNEGYVMNILMPKNAEDFDDAVCALENKNRFLAIDNWDKTGLVKLTLPRFDVSANYNVLNILKDFGLSHISDDIYDMIEQGKYELSQIIQKSKCAVDEDGTKAASVSQVTFITGIKQMFEVTIDRPFFFTIEETSTGAILFMGKVSEFN